MNHIKLKERNKNKECKDIIKVGLSHKWTSHDYKTSQKQPILRISVKYTHNWDGNGCK